MSNRPKLTEVSINGIGVIAQSHLDLKSGFTVITGETGAGKTMILTALNLVLGGKADAALVRHGNERAVASATFELSKEMANNFEELGIISESNELIITRTVNSDGKSKAVAGGISVPISTLNDIAEQLVTIHGQAASQTLTKVNKHRDLLDGFGRYQSEISKYQELFESIADLRKRIKLMASASKERESKLAELREFATAIKKVAPAPGELEEVNDEISKLSSVEDLRIAVSTALGAIDSDDGSALIALNTARKSLEKAAALDPTLTQIYNALNDGYFLVQESTGSLSSYLEDLAADPVRLESLQQRKAELNSFIKKYGDGSEPNEVLLDLIERGTNIQSDLADLSGGDERIKELQNELAKQENLLLQSAAGLSKLRKKSATDLGAKVSAEIHGLSMPNTNFVAQVESLDFNDSASVSKLDIYGGDQVAFQLQTHSDGPLVAISKGASGGELSRVALAIEVVIADSENIGTYIFDEVDAGVGGKAAIEIGKRLKMLAQKSQVIVVTHLPQVAAWADHHFVVEKNESGSVTLSQIKEVENQSRVEELARMLSGHESSNNALKHAAELLSDSHL